MHNKFLLTALVLALSSSAAIAQSELASPAKSGEPAVAQSTSTATDDKSAADSKKALADDTKPKKEKKEKPAKVSTQKSAAKSSSSGNDRLSGAGKFLAHGAFRTVATVAGFAVGTPIAVVRMSIHEDSEQAKCLPILNESSFPPFVWASKMVFIPTALFSGGTQAPISSARNAWSTSADKPFSKESIFLGEYDDRTPQ